MMSAGSVSSSLTAGSLSCVYRSDLTSGYKRFPLPYSVGIVCKVRTQEAENFDEEVKSLVSAWLNAPGTFLCMRFYIRFVNLRPSEIQQFYNLQLFYWHFLEILWLFIFLILYQSSFFILIWFSNL
jgi:hypothetical protein